MKLSELETKRSALLTEVQNLLNAKADRDFNEDEAKRFDALEAEVNTINANIDREKRAESLRLQTALNQSAKDTPEVKAAKEYNFVKAINGQLKGRLDGLEAELSQEAEKELTRSGVTDGVKGAGLPSWAVRVKGTNVHGGQKRDLTSGGTATGAEYIPEVEIGHQFGLEISPKALQLGVEVLKGLTGNVYITETGQAAAVWETEVAAADETTPATSKPVNLSPTRLSAFTDVSRMLLVQTSGVAESRIKTQLEKANNRKLDHTIFQGTGVAPIPTGITATADILTETSGGTPTKQMFLDAWAAIAGQNADFDNIAIATTPAIRAFLMGALLDAGSGRFLMENDMVVGYKAIWSNNVPDDYIIIGDFSKFVVGQWGGVDLIVNPYTRSKESIVEVQINSFWDMGCYRPKAFCVVSDATLP